LFTWRLEGKFLNHYEERGGENRRTRKKLSKRLQKKRSGVVREGNCLQNGTSFGDGASGKRHQGQEAILTLGGSLERVRG